MIIFNPTFYILLFLTSTCFCITLLPNRPGAEAAQWNSPIMGHIGPYNWKFNRTGPITLDKNSNLTGKILIYNMSPFETQDKAARHYNGSGCIGIITLLRANSALADPGLGISVTDGKDMRWSKIPFFELTDRQFEEIKHYIEQSTTNETIGIIVDDDPNPWIYWFKGAPIFVFQGILGVFYAILVAIILGRLIIYWQYLGFALNICQVLHIIQLMANLFRFIFVALDPFGHMHVLSYLQGQMLLTLSFPANVLTMLLVTLYWYELIHKVDAKVNRFLTRMKYPFIIFCIILFIAELVASTMRGLQSNFVVMTYITGIIYLITSVATLIFYFYTQYKLNRTFSEFSSLNTKSTKSAKSINKVSRIYLMCAICMVVWIICIIIGGITPLLFTPQGFFSIWFLAYLTLGMLSAFQIFAFTLPNWRSNKDATSNAL